MRAMIWLSRTEEVDEERADEAGEAIDEAEELDGEIGEKEADLASALEELDEKEKKKEIDAFKGEIDSQKGDWFDLIAEYRKKRKTMEESKVFRLDRIMTDVERYRAEKWSYGSSVVPPFRYFAGLGERKSVIASDSGAHREMRGILSAIEKLGKERDKARDALTGESSKGPTISKRRGSPEVVKIDSVEELVVDSRRNLVEHVIPAAISQTRHSVVYQDMGNAPMTIRFRGLITGRGKGAEEKRQDMLGQVDMMSSFLRTGNPLYFSSSLTNVSGVATRVVLSEFSVIESLEMVDGVRFNCTLLECNPEEEAKEVRTNEASHWRRFVALSAATKYVDSFYVDGKLRSDAEEILTNMIIRGARIKGR